MHQAAVSPILAAGTGMASTKERLHQMVDQLPEDAAGELLEYADWLTRDVDEPLSAEERVRVEAGEAEIARGEYSTLDELRRRLGR